MEQKRLTNAQIAGYARQAGFAENEIPTIVGIANAESSRNPRALNPNRSTGDESYGLMQVNMIDEPGYQLGQERLRQFGLERKDQLYDPLTNMKAAKQIRDSQGLGAWSVYSSGAYKDYVPKETEIMDQAPGGGSVSNGDLTAPANNVLNVYFDQGSQHQDKKNKAKSLVEMMKEGILKNMTSQILNPFGQLTSGIGNAYTSFFSD
tara:strand:+ start:3635 stop:4252 length:618 start_codon:yes stop_codon:yes gene_type:complete